ncbi:MAG: prepilin-type N-terminal cleavage/methylation domain-containing protein [Archangium sp.]|nr:prepilin-type N-terminal cleavage/methylation domain-containing protein [Archangium sp.]MDP3573655.1 prepilin-type N-terminal cleavage/methylation domain-containing protein [Archangium sp.]
MRTSRRGVTLIEGLISTVILLVGMVGVLQGLTIASVQNSMANRHTRASIIAQELMASIEQQGRARLLTASTGLFMGGQCPTTNPLPTFQGDLPYTTSALALQGYTPCYVDFDAPANSVFHSMTPGYKLNVDGTTYKRLIAVYRSTNPEVMYVAVNVGWKDGGQVRVVKRFTAIYDTTTNQTNLDF